MGLSLKMLPVYAGVRVIGPRLWPKLSVIPTWFLKNQLRLRLLLRHRLQWHRLQWHQPPLLRHAQLLLRPQLRLPVLLAKKSVFLPMLSSISTKPF